MQPSNDAETVTIPDAPAECGNRRARSTFYLACAWGLLKLACDLVERAEQYRARAHGIDVKAYDEARAELDRELTERTALLRAELATRELIEQRDEEGAPDEYGVRW